MAAPFAALIAPPTTVAVTGANGFLAQHCIASLLDHGYRVIGTVRDARKADVVKATHKDHEGLAVVIIPNISDAANIHQTLTPYHPEACLHLAAPFSYTATDFEAELMVPATEGTRAVLAAMDALGSVRRVVHTSSFASILDANAKPVTSKIYTAEDWSPLTYEDGVKAKTVAEAYRASKVAAEKVAWDYVKSHQPSFDLVSLCPAMVFGPFLNHSVPKSIGGLNTSNSLVWGAIHDAGDGAIPPTRGPVWVDVRDVAHAHLKSIIVPEAGGKRLLVAASMYSNQELVDVSRQRLPQWNAKIAVGEPGQRDTGVLYDIDASETRRLLEMNWRGLGDCLEALVPQLFEIEATGKGT
ncbi:NAD(P)-binding protein [Sarocladium strictum]